MSKYTHLIWDWNGTLQHDVWLCIEVMNGLLNRRHKPAITLQQYREIFRFPVREYYLKAGLDYENKPFELLTEEYILEYDSRSRECNPQPKIVDI